MTTFSLASKESCSVDLIFQGLQPITPESVSNHRYDNPTKAERSHAHIEAGPFVEPRPQYLPPRWFLHTHPEGKPYFYLKSHLRVVTEAYLYRPEVMDKIIYWSEGIQALLSHKGTTIGENVELLLQLDDEYPDSCAYYFVDHATRSVFWLHEVSTEDLNLYPVTSKSHLRFALEELYWNHVEFFPMHISIHSQAVEDLISVFTHGRADCITSNVSTFPYPAEQCASFLDLLRGCRNDPPSGYTNCTVARLWGNVAGYRFMNHHEQETTRLSRNQSILDGPRSEPHWVSSALSRLLFGVPETYRDRFEDISVDGYVYTNQWRLFMTSTYEDWKTSVSWAFPSLLCTILLSLTPSSSTYLAAFAVLASSSSILSGMLLILQYKRLSKVDASEAASYLHSVRSTTFGFHLLSIAFSLPSTLCLWGVLLFTIQGFMLGVHLIGNTLAFGVTACILVFGLCIWFITRPTKSEGWFSSWTGGQSIDSAV